MENNGIINVEANEVAEVAKKIEFTTGEKTALALVGVGVALIGYGLGTFVVEPIVKKTASGISGLGKKAGKKVKNLKKKDELLDDDFDDTFDDDFFDEEDDKNSEEEK